MKKHNVMKIECLHSTPVTHGRQLLLVGACGNEDWQMLPFCLDAQSEIVSDCENAKEYRKLIGLQI